MIGGPNSAEGSDGAGAAVAAVLAVVGALFVLVVLTATAAASALTLAAPGSTTPIQPPGGTAAGTAAGSAPSRRAADIPPAYLALYQQAAPTCPGLDWTVLAGIGSVETDHGRSRLPGVTSGQNYAGAGGPMQFLAATFRDVVARHPPPPGGSHPPSRYDPHDAIYTAAAYLCDSGAGSPGGLRRAIRTYNHSDAYVNLVLARADSYRADSGRDAPVPRPPR